MTWVAIILSAIVILIIGPLAVGRFCAMTNDAEREVEAHIAANYPDAANDIEPVDMHGVAL